MYSICADRTAYVGRRHTQKGEKKAYHQHSKRTPIPERSRHIDNRRSLGRRFGCQVQKPHIATCRPGNHVIRSSWKLRGKDLSPVNQALYRKFPGACHHELRQSTWDRGMELAGIWNLLVARALKFTSAILRVPWQRGTNENTNGLIRQYFPKKTCLAQYTNMSWIKSQLQLKQRPKDTEVPNTERDTERGVALTD